MRCATPLGSVGMGMHIVLQKCDPAGVRSGMSVYALLDEET